MPIPYSERKKRGEQLAKELPPELRGRIALRHVETKSPFSPQTQRTLAAALETGLRAPGVIAFLGENPLTAAVTPRGVDRCSMLENNKIYCLLV